MTAMSQRRPLLSESASSSTPGRLVYIFAGCAAVNSANLGFDIGITTDAAPEVQRAMGLSDNQTELFVGCLNAFAIFGALSASFFSDALGRRGTFAFAACCSIVGSTLMASAPGYAQLMVGRAIVGLGVGFGLAVDPVYIAEICPAAFRGRLVTWSEIATNAGILLGFLLGYPYSLLDDRIAWRLMLATGTVLPAVVLALAQLVMPESPRWLVAKRRNAEAEEILVRLGVADPAAAIGEIEYAIAEEAAAASGAVGWRALLCPTPTIRRMLVVGVGVAVAQQLCGVNAIQYYMNFIFERSGLKDRATRFAALVGVGTLKLLTIVVAGQMFDWTGRKPLLVGSLAGMAVSLSMVGANFHLGSRYPALAITGIALYFISFSMGMGPGAWLIPSEIFPSRVRAKAMSIATLSNRAAATAVSSSFLSLNNAAGDGNVALGYVAVCLLLMLFMLLAVPETKGKNLEEMLAYFCSLTGDPASRRVLGEVPNPSRSTRSV